MIAKRGTAASVLLLIGVAAGAQLYAGTFSIHLHAQSGQLKQTATNDDRGGTRPVLTAQAKASLHVQWSLVSTEGTDTLEDVIVHFYLTKEQSLGQEPPRKLGPDVAFESALTMDFEPHAQSSGSFTLQVPGQGTYLLRVEAINPDRQVFPGQFAAMDVKVSEHETAP